MVAVVAEPEEKARANRAFSRAATAFSKLSLRRRSEMIDDMGY